MNKKTIQRLAAATLLAAASWTSAMAVPAYPKPIVVTQPDGTQITIQLHGDEHVHWAETTDGYTLLRDEAGYLTFAQLQDGQLVASKLRYQGSSAPAIGQGLAKGLRFSKSQISEMRSDNKREQARKAAAKVSSDTGSLMIDQTFPTTGKRKLLCVLVNFGNTKTTFTRQQFDNLMNQRGYGGIGSFHDFYYEQSHGLLDLDVTVTDWVKLPLNKATYGTSDMTYIIQAALDAITDTLDLRQFDNDGDGILDGLTIIHQGTGQETSNDADDIWSHSSSVYGLKYQGISVTRYTINPELLVAGRMSNIGVLCHEFGHNLGAPDFYDSDYSDSDGEFCGTGVWDLLGSGAWNGTYGDQPAGINGWQKWVYGWLEPTLLSGDTTVTDMPAADVEPVAYRFETGYPGEYFFMENRQQTGTFDGSLPGHGLIVYHVSENIIKEKLHTNDINATYPQGIYTVCSDAGADPDSQPASFGSVNSNGAPFPGEYGHTEFSDNTLPSAKTIEGRLSYSALTAISETDGKISFTFSNSDAPAQPIDLKANAKNGNVTLTWQMPSQAGAVKSYTVYRDDTEIGSTTTATYTDTAPTSGKKITYQVDAVYSDGRASHPTEVTTMVPAERLTALSASTEGGGATLSWQTNNRLTWSNASNGQLVTKDYTQEELEYASRFTASDLQTWVGGKITKMSFLPVQGPSVLTVKFRVYEADADGGDPVLVSERNVKEFANGQSRELTLTQPVTIQAGKDYYVAVNCVSSNGTVSLASDQDDVVSGRGNCIMKGGAFVADGSALGNYYLTATVTPATAVSGTTVAVPDDYEVPTDLYFPRAFAVYRDGELIATVADRQFTDHNATIGDHTYTVSSLFAGQNETKGLSKTVTVTDLSGIDDVQTGHVRVSAVSGGIRVEGAAGRLTVTDLAGRQQQVEATAGSTVVALAPGVYTVSTDRGGQPVKIVVR